MTAGQTNQVTSYGYDALDRLTSASYPAIPSVAGVGGVAASSVSYGYDAVGNRTTMNGQSVAAFDADDRVVGGSYDADGNLLSDGTTSYVYDAAQRLVQRTQQGIVTTYGYDGHGNLVRETTNGVTTNYVLDERGLATILGAIRSDGISTRYAYGPDGVAAQDVPTRQIYLLLDAHGTLRSCTSPMNIGQPRFIAMSCSVSAHRRRRPNADRS